VPIHIAAESAELLFDLNDFEWRTLLIQSGDVRFYCFEQLPYDREPAVATAKAEPH
jgi:hypothetical protein